jgi:hypothetical protein
MLFAVIYTTREDTTEEDQKRTVALFTQWTPPTGYEFKAHYSFADGNGGVAIAEVSTAAALLEAHAPWTSFFSFKTVPVVEIGDAIPILQRVSAWRDSIS